MMHQVVTDPTPYALCDLCNRPVAMFIARIGARCASCPATPSPQQVELAAILRQERRRDSDRRIHTRAS